MWNRSFLSHLHIKPIFYQDRLGTNTGKTPKKAVFLQAIPEGDIGPSVGKHYKKDYRFP
jgi:hypothetical protein